MDSNYEIVKEAFLENNIVLESSLQYPQYRLLDMNEKLAPGTNGRQGGVEFDGYMPNYKHVSCGWTAFARRRFLRRRAWPQTDKAAYEIRLEPP